LDEFTCPNISLYEFGRPKHFFKQSSRQWRKTRKATALDGNQYGIARPLPIFQQHALE
jgi:hypothetical protein